MLKNKSILVILAVFAYFVGYNQDNQRKEVNIDSLVNVSERSGSDRERIDALAGLNKAYLKIDLLKSVEYGEKAIILADESGLQAPPSIYRYLGIALDKLGRKREAIEHLETAITILEQQNASEELSQNYLFLGEIYYRAGEYTEASEIFEKILEEEGLVTTDQQKADALYDLSVVYGALGNEEEQIKNLKKFISLADPGRRKAVAYMMIADILRESKRFGQSIEYYYLSIETSKQINDSILMALAMNHLAWGFYEVGDLEKSLEYYQKNLDISVPTNRTEAITNIYGNIGNIYRDWKDYEKALEYYDKSIDLSNEIGDFYNLSWIYEDIAKMYAGMEDYKKAFEYYQLHSQYNDSLQNQEFQNQLNQARATYEMEKREREVEMLSLKLEQNRLLIYILVGSLLALAIISLLFIQRNRYRTRQRIAAMNHRISELNQQNLRQQMNPHFIFNTLNSIQYYVFRNDKISSNTYMTKFATLMRKTLENSRHTAITVKDEVDALELYLELESIRFKEKFAWKIEVDDEIDPYLFKIPTMLIQPYVENAISHGLMHKENGKGCVKVELKLLDGVILCTIEDNGVGRKKAGELKTNGKNHNSLGTTITESRLRLVNELYGKKMKVSYTDLVDDAGNPAGTRVQINIPIIT